MAKWNPFRKSKPDESQPAEATPADQAGAVPVPDSVAASESPVEPPIESAAVAKQPTSAAEPEPAQPEKKAGFFGKFKQALKKTTNLLNTDLRDLVKEGRLVDDDFLEEIFALMIRTDMGVGPAGKIRDNIKSNFRGRKVEFGDLVASAKETVREIMQQGSADVAMADSGPTIIMVVGVNGAGKTTSIAKLVYRFKEAGKSVVLGAGDTFRAAAVEQLTVWAQRLDAEIITGKSGSDPASVAYTATDKAHKNNADVCIIDTAGRLQTQTNLMDELGRIRRIINKAASNSNEGSTAPHEVLLVLDATAGQNAISQAKGFSDAAGCTGIILAKLDGTAKGGVAIPICQEFGLPVKFIGLGETPDAFARFDVDTFVDALFSEG